MTEEEFMRFRFYFSIGIPLEFRYDPHQKWTPLGPKHLGDLRSALQRDYKECVPGLEYRTQP